MHPAYSVTGEYLPYRAPSVDYHAPSTADDGSWLCSDGPYLEYIRSRCEFQPTLRLPDIRNRSVPLRARLAKVTLLQYQDGSLLSRMDFRLPDDLDRLTRHLSVVNDFIRQEADRRPIQNIYLVEGLNPDVVSALGQGLRVDPAFFADHERTSTYLRLPYEPSLAPRLPSLMDHEQTFSLNYYDIRAPSHKFESFSVGCADSGRDVQISRLNDKWEHPVVVRRRCSVWRTKLSDDNDWAVIILCDPPFRWAHVWHRDSEDIPWEISTIKVTSTPFQGGYADVAPWRFSEESTPSPCPGRENMNDDLVYYLTERVQDLPKGLRSSADATIYLRRIVASQYLHLIEYYEAVLSSQALPLQRKKDFSNMEATSLEGQWSDKQLICSRLNRYIKDVATILLQLGVPIDNQQPSNVEPSWIDSAKDFKHIYAQLLVLKERADFLNGSLTALTSIIGNKRAIRETKTVKTLTLVAMIFIPLAFTAALLSMYDEFLPGKEKFWVFFAVSAPMVTAVFAATFLFDLGYDANGNWNWGVYQHHFKKKVKMLC